jgi:hypothetical protein
VGAGGGALAGSRPRGARKRLVLQLDGAEDRGARRRGRRRPRADEPRPQRHAPHRARTGIERERRPPRLLAPRRDPRARRRRRRRRVRAS